MVSGDFCEHGWPGSGCDECRKVNASSESAPDDLVAGIEPVISTTELTVLIESLLAIKNPTPRIPYVARLLLKRAVVRMQAQEARIEAAEAERDALMEALEGACAQILDSYRTWVADDIEAHPKPGQIPRYDHARATLRPEAKGGREDVG